MKKRILIRTTLLASLGLLLATSAMAGPHHGRGRNAWQAGEGPGAACVGKAEGDKIQITTPGGTAVDLVCMQDFNGALQARPEGVYRHHQALISACNGKQAGDKVSVTGPSGYNMEAVCRQRGDKLLPLPERGAGFDGPGCQAFLDACQGKKPGDKVQVETPCGIPTEGTCIQQGENLLAKTGNVSPCGGSFAPCYGPDGGGPGYYGHGHGRGCRGRQGGSWGCNGAGPNYHGPRHGIGNNFIQGACQGRSSGEKVSFEAPCGAKVEITCGDTGSKK